MITGEIKSQVDRIWDSFWSGGISNPLEVVEQMTYLLFIKRLDELHTVREKKANRLKKPIEKPIFSNKQQNLRWSVFKQLGDPQAMFDTVANEVFPFMKALGIGNGEEGSTYATHMKDARFTIPTPALLAKVVDMLDHIPMDDRDTKGDLYEYMLGKIASAGQNGQFRTPRHIIKLMVEMMAPRPDDTICDPACGTAGFLVAASEYLYDHYQSEIYASADSARRFNHDTFHGFDFDSTMLRVGSMNMLLHGVENPAIENRDSLSEGHASVAERFSLVLANPPFSGSLDYENCAKDLLALVKTKKTELLFVTLFMKILKSGGRAAVVVPSGVIESDSSAHDTIRKMLVEDMQLQAIISLPHWVFKPYASVATSILIFQKSAQTDRIWFFRLDNDGFANSAGREPIEGSEINQLLDLWSRKNSKSYIEEKDKHRFVTIDEIRDNNYDLCPRVYLSGYEYPKGFPLVTIGSLFDVVKGSVPAASAEEGARYPFYTSSREVKYSSICSHESEAIIIPTVSSTGHGHASINHIHYASGHFSAATITAVLLPKVGAEVYVPYVYYYLLSHKDVLLVPQMRGAANVSLNLKRLENLRIPLPDSYQEQKDKVSDIIGAQNRLETLSSEISDAKKSLSEQIKKFSMEF